MSIQLIKREQQADGNFNNGEILEKKPIGFPQDGGITNHIQIYFIGLTHGLQIKKVQ